jgi:hypothetical protein
MPVKCQKAANQSPFCFSAEQTETPALPLSDPDEPALRPLRKEHTVADQRMIHDKKRDPTG